MRKKLVEFLLSEDVVFGKVTKAIKWRYHFIFLFRDNLKLCLAYAKRCYTLTIDSLVHDF